jgi:Spy/CpxP family protein refolding chaperone
MSHNLVVRAEAPPFWMSPKFAGVGMMLLVFLCGSVAGAVAINIVHPWMHQRPFWDNSAKAEHLKKVTRELDLTPAQSAQMGSILDDFAKYYQTVLFEGKARIMNILNDTQKAKFEKLLKEQTRN